MRRAGLALLFAALSVPLSAMAGEKDAPALVEKAREALQRGDGRALGRLVCSDRVAAFEAVERLLNDSADAPPALASELARAYRDAYDDAFLVERVELFRSWSPAQRAARDQARRWNDAARVAQKEGRQDEALEGFERALKVLREVKDRRVEARTLLNMAGSLALKGESRRTLAVLDEALAVGRLTGDQVLLAAVGMNRAYALEDLGDFTGEREALDATLPLARAIGDREGEAIVLMSLSSLALHTSRVDEAERLSLEVERIGEDLSDEATRWAAFINLAEVAQRRGDLEKGAGYLRRAAASARRGGLPVQEAGAEYNLSNNARRRGDLVEARRDLERARAAVDRTDDAIMKGTIEVGEANLLVEEGRYAETPAFLDAAQARLRGIEVAAVLSELHQTRAMALFYLGDYEGAVTWMRRALDQAIVASRADLEASCRSELGRLLMVLGDKAAALAELDRGSRLFDETGDPRGRATTEIWIGEVKLRAGDRTGARDALRQAVAALDRPETKRQRAEAMTSLAALELESGPERRALATDLLRRSLEIFVAGDDLRGVSLASLVEADAALENGDTATARAALERIARVARGRRNAEFDWQIRYTEGKLAEAAGDVPGALDRYERAVAEVEMLRGGVRPPAWRAAIQEDRIGPYRSLVRLHRRRGEVEKAWMAARAAKARTFAEQLRPVEFPTTREDHAPRRETSEAMLPAPAVPSERVRSLLRDGEALIDLFFDGDELLAFVVRRGGTTLRSTRLPLEVLQAARYPGRPDASGSAVTNAWQAATRRLGEALFEPLAADLAEARHLLIVPGGPLHGIPFAALDWRGRPIIERWDVSILPAAESLFARARREGAGPTHAVRPALALGDPDANDPAGRLSGAGEEAALVASLSGAGSELFVGPQASEALVRGRAARFDRIHLAAHGRIDRLAPARSYIALAPGDGEDGRLEAREIAAMRISASLVVLSGCDTGIDAGITRDDPPGDERIGLARAFLTAGAGSVVAGLWEVQDRASSRIMPELYARMEGAGPAEALARLQRDLIAGRVTGEDGRPLDHPFYWAGLVLYGAGGPERSGDSRTVTAVAADSR